MNTPTTRNQANARLIAAATQPRPNPAIIEIVHEMRDMSTLDKAGLIAFMLAPRAVRRRILQQMRRRVQ